MASDAGGMTMSSATVLERHRRDISEGIGVSESLAAGAGWETEDAEVLEA